MGSSLTVGEVLEGKYRVEQVLGSGGMGEVVRAYHLHLDCHVAIKFLLPEALEHPEAVARFAREARAATKIQSEHVVRVIDVSTLESGAPYMVMEFLEGSDLSHVVRTQGPLPFEEAADFLLQACEAIAEAHALGIVHRDLKPANLFLTRRMDGTPLVKVLDFGISKVRGSSEGSPDFGLTKTSVAIGSPYYMSPEQLASSRDVDHRTDIWALGAIFYELVTGSPPFQAESLPQLCAKVGLGEPEPASAVRQSVPPAVDEVIARCLRKAPHDRYADVAELCLALGELAPQRSRVSVERVERVLRGKNRPGSLPPAEAPPAHEGPVAKSISTSVAWGETLHRGSSKRKLALALGGAIAVSLPIVLLVWWPRTLATPETSVAGPGSTTEPSEPVAPPDVPAPPSAPSASAEVAPAVPSAPMAVPAPSAATTAKPPTENKRPAKVAKPTEKPSSPAAPTSSAGWIGGRI